MILALNKSSNIYKENRKRVEKDRKGYPCQLGVLTVKIWNGSRTHRHVIGKSTVFGFIKRKTRTWLINYNDTGHQRYDIDSHRVIKCRIFNNLSDFKRYLGRKVDLRKFKKFLRLHKVRIR